MLFLAGGLAQMYVIIIGGQAFPLKDLSGHTRFRVPFADGAIGRYIPDVAGGAARDQRYLDRHAADGCVAFAPVALPAAGRARESVRSFMFREPHPFRALRQHPRSRQVFFARADDRRGAGVDGHDPRRAGAARADRRLSHAAALQGREAGRRSPGFVDGRARAVSPEARPARRRSISTGRPTAGKKRQLPWYILAALAIAGSGKRVLMHGADGHTAGRIYSTNALAALGRTRRARDAERRRVT